MNNLFHITDRAILELKQILQQSNEAQRLRVFCEGGGCAGILVRMHFTKFPPDEEFDILFEREGVQFIIDQKSALFLADATLDYHYQDLLDRGFKWNVPNKGGCGCGVSFEA